MSSSRGLFYWVSREIMWSFLHWGDLDVPVPAEFEIYISSISGNSFQLACVKGHQIFNFEQVSVWSWFCSMLLSITHQYKSPMCPCSLQRRPQVKWNALCNHWREDCIQQFHGLTSLITQLSALLASNVRILTQSIGGELLKLRPQAASFPTSRGGCNIVIRYPKLKTWRTGWQ